MKWCFGEEATEVSRALLALLEDKAAFVPSHWYLEVANTLAMAIRKSRIPEKQAAEFLRLLRELAIYSDPLTSTLAFEDTFMLAKKYNLTTYDAAYLELALRIELPLASADGKLLDAAQKAGAEIIAV